MLLNQLQKKVTELNWLKKIKNRKHLVIKEVKKIYAKNTETKLT